MGPRGLGPGRQIFRGGILKKSRLKYGMQKKKAVHERGTSQFGTSGFNDWKHASDGVNEHENSSAHRDCVLNFKARGSENVISVFASTKARRRSFS